MTNSEYSRFKTVFKCELAYRDLFNIANRLSSNSHDLERVASDLTTISLLTLDDNIADDILKIDQMIKTLDQYAEGLRLIVESYAISKNEETV
jgi:hypothetical protein